MSAKHTSVWLRQILAPNRLELKNQLLKIFTLWHKITVRGRNKNLLQSSQLVQVSALQFLTVEFSNWQMNMYLTSTVKLNMVKFHTSTSMQQGDHSFSTMIFHDFSMTKKINFHDLSAQHILSK